MLRAFVFGFACWFFAVAAFAQAEATPKPFDSAKRLAEIEAALASEASFQYQETPLNVVLEHLSDRHKVPFHLDQRALDLLGISPDQAITIDLESIRLSDGLTLLLRDLDLHWTVYGGVIEVTVPEEVDARLQTVVYDVTNLYQYEPFDTSSHYDTGIHGEPRGWVYLITRTIDPESWESWGGPGTLERWHNGEKDLIIVRQTWHTHKLVRAFLEDLTKHAPLKKKNDQADRVSTKIYVAPEHTKATPEELAKLVQIALAEEDWSEGRSVTAIANSLVIKQTPAVQRKIADILISYQAASILVEAGGNFHPHPEVGGGLGGAE